MTHLEHDQLRLLPSGRVVFDTGRVQIGARYSRPLRDISSDALRLQEGLLRGPVRVDVDRIVGWVCGVGLVGVLVALKLGWLL